MTVQQALGLAAACVAALFTYLVAADVNNDIPNGYMVALGGLNVVLGAANVFFGQVVNMARTVLARNPAVPDVTLRQAAKK